MTDASNLSSNPLDPHSNIDGQPAQPDACAAPLDQEAEKKPKRKPAKKSEKKSEILAEPELNPELAPELILKKQNKIPALEKNLKPTFKQLDLKLDKNTEEKLLAIKKSREDLLIKINQIQGRLLSGYSKPLEQSLMALLKQDMALISQTTDLLTFLRP